MAIIMLAINDDDDNNIIESRVICFLLYLYPTCDRQSLSISI